jgi:hypothetical protein
MFSLSTTEKTWNIDVWLQEVEVGVPKTSEVMR